jgi:hypothetical protein
MNIFLISNWHFMNEEIWEKLESSENAIEDLYSILLDSYLTIMKDTFFNDEKHLNDGRVKQYWDLVGASNDKVLARGEFYKLPPPPNEKYAIDIIENYYQSLLENDYRIANKYRDFLKDFLQKFGVRYFITKPCKLTITIEGLLATEYDYIKYLSENSRSPSRKQLIKIFENHLVKINEPDEENNCIANSIKLIEHFILDTISKKKNITLQGRQRTLGYAIKECIDIFPSTSAKESLKKYYDFTNEYPNIRHVGEDSCVIRDLNKSDALLALSLAVAYSVFLTQNYEDIIYGKYIKIK